MSADLTLNPAPRGNASRKGPNRHTRRWLPWLGVVVLAVLVGWGLWPKPVPVETAAVSVGLLRASVNEEGKTRVKQRYVVSAPVAGQLRRIPFKAGAEVEAGRTVVAVIDPVLPTLLDARSRAQAVARRDAASASLEKAKSSRAFASTELKRYQKLAEEKTISVQELDNTRLRDTFATREEAAAESALRQAEADLAEFGVTNSDGGEAALAREVKPPASGRVLRVFEENARVVAPGTPLMEVGDPGDLEVVVEVLSRDGAAISPGTRVEFDQWGGAEPLEGKVRLVEPAGFTKVSALGVEEQRVRVVADLVTPPERRPTLGDNFRVEARIIVWEAKDALKVPVGALFRRGEQWAVFVVAAGRAEIRLVKPGRSSGTETQILEGLKPGEEVVLYPGSRVKSGLAVRRIQL